MLRFFYNCQGITLLELMVSMSILSILATGILPLSQVTYKRVKEMELRQNLRVIRKAIDEYKMLVDEGKISKDAMSSGYPKDLEVLVKGVELKGPVPFKQKFLRRIPKDPMTEEGEWQLRSYSDESDSTSWGGQDVYDIYSGSDKQALDGTYYRDW
ncbi:General secretion pathway protein GspG [Candidatus Magnetomoraceae bacterium gMMP-15]